jgi:hypothetical protein
MLTKSATCSIIFATSCVQCIRCGVLHMCAKLFPCVLLCLYCAVFLMYVQEVFVSRSCVASLAALRHSAHVRQPVTLCTDVSLNSTAVFSGVCMQQDLVPRTCVASLAALRHELEQQKEAVFANSATMTWLRDSGALQGGKALVAGLCSYSAASSVSCILDVATARHWSQSEQASLGGSSARLECAGWIEARHSLRACAATQLQAR